MAATVRVGGFVHRSCSRHGSYAIREGAEQGCPRCREQARDARKREARRVAAGLTCDECGTTLLAPAVLCGFCDPAFDLDAALQALDNEGAGGDVTRPGAATHGRNP